MTAGAAFATKPSLERVLLTELRSFSAFSSSFLRRFASAARSTRPPSATKISSVPSATVTDPSGFCCSWPRASWSTRPTEQMKPRWASSTAASSAEERTATSSSAFGDRR